MTLAQVERLRKDERELDNRIYRLKKQGKDNLVRNLYVILITKHNRGWSYLVGGCFPLTLIINNILCRHMNFTIPKQKR